VANLVLIQAVDRRSKKPFKIDYSTVFFPTNTATFTSGFFRQFKAPRKDNQAIIFASRIR
jgi:hypothetical protein